jgi:hypothetical protein
MMKKFLSRAGRVAAALTLAGGLVFAGAQATAAAEPTIATPIAMEVAYVAPVALQAVDDGGGVTFTVPALADAVQIVETVALPLLVGWLTRREFQHKALVLLAAAAVTGLGSELLATLQAGAVFDITDGIFRAVLSFGAAVLLHYGLYKPEGTTAAVQRLGPQ